MSAMPNDLHRVQIAPLFHYLYCKLLSDMQKGFRHKLHRTLGRPA